MTKKNIRQSRAGLTILETTVSVVMFVVLFATVAATLGTGRSTLITLHTSNTLNTSLNTSLERIKYELIQSGRDGNGLLQTRVDAGGPNGSKILRISVPVICQNGESLVDSTGKVNQWGAPIQWGCNGRVSCDNGIQPAAACTSTYKCVEYRISDQNELIRQIVEDDCTVALNQGTPLTSVIASNIYDLQVTINSNFVTVTITAAAAAVTQDLIRVTNSFNLYFRNI